jgi:exo-beta-1,3-glucanase (GH17 family)
MIPRIARPPFWALLALLVLFPRIAGSGGASVEAIAVRPFEPFDGERWLGNAVSYGPYRDGQRPGGPGPTAAQVREDLQLMIPHWNLLRIYGAGEPAATILQVIREDELDMKVMLGAWIAADAEESNEQEIAQTVRLAAEYRDIVLAVSVGNETQVFWSAHRSPLDRLIGYVRRVRAEVEQPVTVADDYQFWNKPESLALSREIDFITMHAHPMWNGLQLEDALGWTADQVAAVGALHPDRTVVLGETGWATRVHDEGEQAELIKGRFGEPEQKIFYRAARAWADSTRTTMFYFEAFDENWKGGEHPDEVEKHWGVFRADRTPKPAVGPEP